MFGTGSNCLVAGGVVLSPGGSQPSGLMRVSAGKRCNGDLADARLRVLDGGIEPRGWPLCGIVRRKPGERHKETETADPRPVVRTSQSATPSGVVQLPSPSRESTSNDKGQHVLTQTAYPSAHQTMDASNSQCTRTDHIPLANTAPSLCGAHTGRSLNEPDGAWNPDEQISQGTGGGSFGARGDGLAFTESEKFNDSSNAGLADLQPPGSEQPVALGAFHGTTSSCHRARNARDRTDFSPDRQIGTWLSCHALCSLSPQHILTRSQKYSSTSQCLSLYSRQWSIISASGPD